MTTETLPANYREWTTVDKSEWGPGPWQSEPDKVQWIDPATGFDCLLHRGPGGHWCGYVGVAEGHPLFGVGYSECPQHCADGDSWHCDHTPETMLRVHGGLTFAAECADSGDESTGICHVAAEGRPDHVWWLGFDCAHAFDASPARAAREIARGWTPMVTSEVYRDRAYVEAEIRSLAAQLAEIG